MPMPGPESLQIMGYILLALALPVLAWAVLGDTARGRLRCPKCWYRMEGIPKQESGWICPECGRKIAKERGLRRARRRWRWAVPALLSLVLASQLWQQPYRMAEGVWTKWIPSSLVVTAIPLRGGTEWLDAIHNRLDTMPRWQRSVLRWRDWRPARAALIQLPFTRDRWPVGVQPVIWLRDTSTVEGTLGPRLYGRVLRMTLKDDQAPLGALELELSVDAEPMPTNAPKSGFKLPASDLSGQKVVILRLELSDDLYSRSVDVPIEYTVVPSLQEVIRPVDSAEMAEEMRSGVLAHWDGDSDQQSAWVSADAFNRMAVFRRQVTSNDGQTTETSSNGHFWMMRAGRQPPSDSPTIYAAADDFNTYLRDHLKLRVWEDPVLTLQRYPDATSYWSGSVEIPMKEANDRHLAATRIPPVH